MRKLFLGAITLLLYAQTVFADPSFKEAIVTGIPQELPEPLPYDLTLNHPPKRKHSLTIDEKILAVKNALRYFPPALHETLAPEFAQELETYGHIYMYRFRPQYPMHARPISEYPAQCVQAAAIMLMIQNNLDPTVAQHPMELITYGGNGAVFQNWAQYLLTMQYLSQMTEEQTLVMYSGHPLGLFPSHKNAPRVVVTNGMVIPNYSKPQDLENFGALGVTQYGQMTAGSYMYIGSQGIVHGTTITLLNASRKLYREGFKNREMPRRRPEFGPGEAADEADKPERFIDAGGSQIRWLPDAGRTDFRITSGIGTEKTKLFVSSGLGGMSGAQPKAGNIAGVVSLIAEVNEKAAKKRHQQGWVDEIESDVDKAIDRALACQANDLPRSIAFLGNIVTLWERLAARDVRVDLGSDQTSLHNPFAGGYYPVGLTVEESNALMIQEPERFKTCVQNSLKRHADAINALAAKGMYFFDYGNAFLLEAKRAGAHVVKENGQFTYPSYVQDIMGPLCFDYGFGPFRWVCTSGNAEDLNMTDDLAGSVLRQLKEESEADIQQQLEDNIRWIEGARAHHLVIGSQARILYANAEGRIRIASAFNQAIREGKISAPVVLGRDHHDVSGTDSPFRETSNIYDGSQFTADMAVQNVIGDSFRGATWVSLHNGGGTGWGEAINGGFGLVLDGSEECENRLKLMLYWDVTNGLTRRSWARSEGAMKSIQREMEKNQLLQVTYPQMVENSILEGLFK